MEKNKQTEIPTDKETSLQYLAFELKFGHIDVEQYNKEVERINEYYKEGGLHDKLTKDGSISYKPKASKEVVESCLDNTIPKVESNPSIKSDHMYQEIILSASTVEQSIDMLHNTGFMFAEDVKHNPSLEETINILIQSCPLDTSLISDGKKTFGQLYSRIQELIDERDGN